MKKTITKILCLAVAVFAVSVASAQQGYEKCNEVFRLGVEARFDYLNQALAGDKIAENHYTKLSVNANSCVKCGHCESRCPFSVKQPERMSKIAQYFNK
jgi:predicted aldo/keto reductase-like oxidoreductase